ncbi:Ca2+-binding EF-hand superfamily protein [Streptosporangium album]|uniref:Ca2+-binding EF-hand superfamily protein n=1 Tax=Streptosporangium album TaxID=47479 RepID=A0A7W7RRK4_9ACTN|nr:EF-hand domain-containing protein [Streptosporangium album]MBB4936577.1 Ca2+-binding EF-hand superfamily protein [Streptosporangium album]
MKTEVKGRKLARHFELLDFDGDGFIEQADIRMFAQRICEAAGVEPSSRESQKVLKEGDKLWHALQDSLDHDGDQRVSRQEFIGLAESDSVMAQAIQLGMAAFDVIDIDGDGRISRDEWTTLDKRIGVPAADSREGFSRLDIDMDGFVTRAEFAKGVEEFYRSSDVAAPGNLAFGKF